MEGLTLRPATPDDIERIAELIGGDPGPEMLGMIEDRALARRFSMALVRLPQSRSWQRSVVAELEGKAVGVIQAGVEQSPLKISPSLIWTALRTLGPLRAITLARRFRATQRVTVTEPAGSFYIAELQVDPAYRNRGLGGEMLRYAEERARAEGATLMSLSTQTSNPARRLYERHGFRVIETRTDAAYERYTGSEGRVLMVKELA